jgi:predicted amidophosphoribosyltransferase
MKTGTQNKILELIKSSDGLRPHELVQSLSISAVAVHKQLRTLINKGLIEKRGRSPTVIYVAISNKIIKKDTYLSSEQKKIIDENFCYFTPSGVELFGTEGFITFLQNTKQDSNTAQRANEYIDIISEASQFKESTETIDGTKKISNTFQYSHLTKLYYSDFYSLPKYGKTKLGQYLLHGKSGQNIQLIKRISQLTKQHILSIIKKHQINAISFVPHSIPRKISFLQVYKKDLNLNLPEITLFKAYSGTVPIAQKSLSKLSERTENARHTIFVKDRAYDYQRILAIDDAVGSGATLNEIAAKLIKNHKNKSCEVYGYAIVGSYKGFEVLKEV